jgi:hypothetical protein
MSNDTHVPDIGWPAHETMNLIYSADNRHQFNLNMKRRDVLFD